MKEEIPSDRLDDRAALPDSAAAAAVRTEPDGGPAER